MRLHAWVAPAVAALWQADPFLSGFRWTFYADGAAPPPGPLALAVTDDPARLPPGWAQEPACETWLFSTAAGGLDLSDEIARFACRPEVANVADRLMAWFWIRGRALPVTFSGCQLELMNGLASVRAGHYHVPDPQDPCMYGMHVVSHGACGGDLALRLNLAGRDLFVLADALGKGEKAAQDVALFADGALALLKRQTLDDGLVHSLASYMAERLSFPRFVAAILIEFDWQRRIACLVNAGMPAVLTSCIGMPMREFAADGPPFGVPGSVATCRRVALNDGELWLMTSDGVEEEVRQSALSRLAVNPEHGMASLVVPSFHLAFAWHTARPPAGMDDASLILIQTHLPER
jgi:hypothetical protein